jgi:acyl carrier protein
MDRPALLQALREMVEETTGEPCPPIDEGHDLREGLGLDSVDLFSLVIETQSRFQIKIASGDLDGITRVGDFLDVVQAKLAAAGSSSSQAA